MQNQSRYLSELLQAVEDALQSNREMLNGFDRNHPLHGDQMVEIFQFAKQSAEDSNTDVLGEALDFAGKDLQSRLENGLAQIYGQGLCQIAEQLKRANISFEELVLFTRKQLGMTEQNQKLDASRSAEILKALTIGLLHWKNAAQGKSGSRLGLGDLFEIGIAYQQAKIAHEDPAAALAQAAVFVSPLRQEQVFKLSGRTAFESLLRAIGGKRDEQ